MTIVPAVPEILDDFGVPRGNSYSTLLVSIWELGEGLGPFAIGPLTELFGRLPIYHGGNVLFVVFLAASALSKNVSMLITFRFLAALCVTPLTLGPVVAADLFTEDERGTAMALSMMMPLLAPPGAPLVGSFVTQARGWQWAIWVVVIASGAVGALSAIVFRETYKVHILQKRLQRQPLRVNSKTEPDAFSRMRVPWSCRAFRMALMRPVKLMLLSPVVLIISVYMAVAYGMMYIVLTTLTEILMNTYEFAQGPLGLGFLGLGECRAFFIPI